MSKIIVNSTPLIALAKANISARLATNLERNAYNNNIIGRY